jgi:CRISPR/Cas system CSM-associated protein Csm4 (group 5 of RAMP superfamily)
MKLAFLSVKFLGCRIFVDHCVFICHAGNTVLFCGDTSLAFRIGWSIFTFDKKLISAIGVLQPHGNGSMIFWGCAHHSCSNKLFASFEKRLRQPEMEMKLPSTLPESDSMKSPPSKSTST